MQTVEMRDLFKRIYGNPVTLADIGIDKARTEKAMLALASVLDTDLESVSFLSQADVTKVMLRKQIEDRVMADRSAKLVEKAYQEVKAKQEAEAQVTRPIHQQATPTFAPDDDRSPFRLSMLLFTSPPWLLMSLVLQNITRWSSPKPMSGAPAGNDTHRFRGRAKYTPVVSLLRVFETRV